MAKNVVKAKKQFFILWGLKMKKAKLKLFVWDDYARDYTSGLAVALAENAEQARQLIEENVGYRDSSLCQSPRECDLNTPIAFQICGGS